MRDSLFVVTAMAWVAICAVAARAQDTPRIWQGVYSAAQAERGKATFNDACIRCHGADLAGTTAPALKGDRFMSTFGNETVDRLFVKIRDTMPPNFGTAVLGDAAKIDIVSYILQTNGFPAGGPELTAAGLAGMQIVRKGEQAIVTNFALVETVGCLTRGPGDSWMLTKTTEPAVTRDDAPTPEALTAAAGRALGTGTFLLLSARPYGPAAHQGHKMEARGLVYKDPVDARLTLTSLQMVGTNCGP
jgi:quinoprotein glucose dehydrogenase